MPSEVKMPNAKKWTPEVINKHLYAIKVTAGEPGVWFLKWALRRQGLANHVWSYWKRTIDDDDMLERMYLIEDMFEVKIFTAALRREIPAKMAIWALKYVHKWGSPQYYSTYID